jgi:tRNA(Ile2) C34 agmatinyltransferase TiaS
MNPILQAVMSRVISKLASRCPVCDGRLRMVSSGKHQRLRCVTCGADVPRHVRGNPTRDRRADEDVPASLPLRRPSHRRRRTRS